MNLSSNLFVGCQDISISEHIIYNNLILHLQNVSN